MRKLAILLAATTALSLQTQAQSWGRKTITGNRREKTETRSVPAYEALTVYGTFDVQLVPGKSKKLKVKADGNILPYIITKVIDKSLQIKFKSGYNYRNIKYLTVIVPAARLKEIKLRGSGDIESTFALTQPHIQINSAGSGDIGLVIDNETLAVSAIGSGELTLRGQTRNVNYMIAGSGDIKGFDLKATNANIRVSGSGNIALYCSGRLKALIMGSGDVTYRGNPEQKDTKVKGSGSISAD